MPVPESLPVSDADVDTFAGNFPMGDVWEGLEDVDKVAYNTLVLGLWRSLRWRQSPFDDTDEGNKAESLLTGIYAVHLRHAVETQGNPETLLPSFLRSLLASYQAKGRFGLSDLVKT